MIVPTLARMLIREHIYRPIKGKVLALGRQTIAMSYEQLIELLEQEKFPVSEETLKDMKIKYDTQTRVGKETDFISDEFFFNLLGIEKVDVMDVSDYEGADILHDLNEPVPDSLVGQFDFIIDGGTFDHLIDLRMAFENVVKMLKPCGRVFQWNAASNFIGAAYLSFGPDLFYDYYTLNKFADCKVYVAAVDDISQNELWDLYEFLGNAGYGHFYSKRILMTIVMAEKGRDSTYNSIPVQAQYRDAHLLRIYKDNQKIIASSDRKSYKGTKFGIKVSKFKTCMPAKRSIINRIALKYKEKGLVWVYRRSLEEMGFLFRRHLKGEISGFKYVGKI